MMMAEMPPPSESDSVVWFKAIMMEMPHKTYKLPTPYPPLALSVAPTHYFLKNVLVSGD